MSKKVFVQADLQKKFPQIKVKQGKEGLTAHFNDLSGFELKQIIEITDAHKVEFGLKRSGTGITVVIDVEDN